MRTLTLIILLVIWPSAAYSWQWRITERANCANGQCSPVVSPSNGSAVFRSIGSPSSGVQQIAGTLDCPDGRCPLVKSNATRPSTIALVLPQQSPMLLKRGQDIRRIEPSIVAGTQLCLPVCEGGLCKPSRVPRVQGESKSLPSGGFSLQPTLAPPEPRVIVQARPLRSVCNNCKPKQRVFNGPIARWLRGGK